MNVLKFALLTLVLQAPPLPTNASVRGKVVEWGTTTGIPQAIVELRDIDNPGSAPAAMTATLDNGEFVIPKIYRGTFQVVVTRSGFAPAAYGQRRPSGTPVPIKLSDGQDLTGITIPMAHGGDISGRVIDRNGQPAAFTVVKALAASTQIAAQTAITNDLGEYRLFWLSPGPYFITAEAANYQTFGTEITVNPNGNNNNSPTWSAAIRRTASVPRPPGLDEGESNIAVYYPGVPDLKSATLINLRAGEDVRDVNIKIVPARTYSIRGVAIEAASRQVLTTQIRVDITQLDAFPQSGRALQFSPNDGRFQFSGYRPGTYQLRASSGNLGGVSTVTVLDHDVDVQIRMLDPTSIAGIVKMDSGDGKADLNALRINMHFTFYSSPVGNPSADGIFTIANVPAGEYQVEVSPIMPQYTGAPPPAGPKSLQDAYVKSIRMGEVDVLNGLLHVEGPLSGPLEVVIGANGGLLKGTVTNDRKEPIANATVALIPSFNPLNRRDRFKTAMTDDKGEFQIRAIAPGEYGVIAWEDVDPNAWLDSNFTQIYRAQTSTLKIDEGTNPELHLTAVPIIP